MKRRSVHRGIIVSLAGLLALPCPGPRAAGGATMMQEEVLFGELPVVYIASKMKDSVLTAPGTVYVVTEEEIKRYGWRDLKDILRAIPNIDYKWDWHWLSGGQRGFNGSFNQTQLLIDGRDVTHLFADEPHTRENFPASRIKRLEVLMGPNSALYGSGALEGVINVITKTADEDQGDIQQVQVMAGDVQTSEVSGLIHKKSGDFTVGLFVSRFDSARNYKELANFAGNVNDYSRLPNSTRNGATGEVSIGDNLRDKDPNHFENGERDQNVDAHVKWKDLYGGFNGTEMFGANMGMENVDKWGYSNRRHDRSHSLTYGGIKHKWGAGTEAFVEYRHIYELVNDSNAPKAFADAGTFSTWDEFSDVVFSSYTASQNQMHRRQIVVQGSHRIDAGLLGESHQLLAGYDYYADEYARNNEAGVYSTYTNPAFTPANIQNMYALGFNKKWRTDVFLQDTVGMFAQRLRLTMGVLYDSHKFMKDSWSPRGSLVFLVTPMDALKYTYSEGFHGPSTFDVRQSAAQNSAEFTFFPSTMRMHELNYTGTHSVGGFTISPVASVYFMQENTVLTSFTGGVWVPSSQKLGIRGVEAMVKAERGGTSGFVSARLIDRDKQTRAGQEHVYYVSPFHVKGGVSRDVWRNIGAALFVEHWGKVWDDASGLGGVGVEARQVPAWTVANLNIRAGDVALAPDIKADFNLYVENLTNKAYYIANHRGTRPVQYLQAPRNIRFSATIHF